VNVQKEQVDEIISKWLTNTATEDEISVLKRWAGQNEENLKLLDELEKVWDEDTAEPILVNFDAKANEIWANAMHEQPKQSVRWNLLFRYAAAILILTGSIFYIKGFLDVSESEQKDSLAVAPTFIVRENTPGQKTKIYLPDGSIAYLNSSSSLRYLANFESPERRVILEGEAFFEVAKDLKKRFIVESNSIETVALGTAFNVNAFNPEEIRISLVEGKVGINQAESTEKLATLIPGNEVIVNIHTQEFQEQPFVLEDVIGWKEGKLVLNHASLDEVLINLERWYGVEITVMGKAPSDWQISTVYNNQALKNVLTDLQYSKKFAYEIKDSNVTLTF